LGLRGGEIHALGVIAVRLVELGELADRTVDFVSLLKTGAFIQKRQVGFNG
jgi:hypothetical protein